MAWLIPDVNLMTIENEGLIYQKMLQYSVKVVYNDRNITCVKKQIH